MWNCVGLMRMCLSPTLGLPHRVTFHPMVPASNQSQASQRDLDKRFGPGRVYAAIDLTDYDPKYASIMKTFFGNVVICEHMEDAKVRLHQNSTFICYFKSD